MSTGEFCQYCKTWKKTHKTESDESTYYCDTVGCFDNTVKLTYRVELIAYIVDDIIIETGCNDDLTDKQKFDYKTGNPDSLSHIKFSIKRGALSYALISINKLKAAMNPSGYIAELFDILICKVKAYLILSKWDNDFIEYIYEHPKFDDYIRILGKPRFFTHVTIDIYRFEKLLDIERELYKLNAPRRVIGAIQDLILEIVDEGLD